MFCAACLKGRRRNTLRNTLFRDCLLIYSTKELMPDSRSAEGAGYVADLYLRSPGTPPRREFHGREPAAVAVHAFIMNAGARRDDEHEVVQFFDPAITDHGTLSWGGVLLSSGPEGSKPGQKRPLFNAQTIPQMHALVK
jgi:hypothetical protein